MRKDISHPIVPSLYRTLFAKPSFFTEGRFYLALRGQNAIGNTISAALTEQDARELRDELDSWLDGQAETRMSEIERKRLRAEEANLETGVRRLEHELTRLEQQIAGAAGAEQHILSGLRRKKRALAETQEKLRGL